MSGNDMDTPLPDGWQWKTLSECATVIQGQSPPGDTYNDEGVGLPFFQGKAEFGDLYPSVVKWCSAPTKIAQPDDVLVSVRAPVGPTNLANTECCIGRGLAAVRPLNGTPSRYLLYALRRFESDLAAKATGSTFSAISGAQLRAQPIPLPPLPEQHRIVAAIETHLTRLDAAVAALERARARLKRYRAAVLKAACEGRLVPTEVALARTEGRPYKPAPALLARIQEERTTVGTPGPSTRRHQPSVPLPGDLPDLPEGWSWTTMGMISDVQGGIQKQPKRAPVNNAYPFLRVANVPRGRLDLSDVHRIELFGNELARLRLVSGDLLIVEGNGSASEIGRMAIWAGAIEDCVHQNHLIRARLAHGVLPSFVESYWNSPDGTSRVLNVASSTSGLHTLSVGKIHSLPVPIPPLAEQERIVAEVERRLSVLDQLDAAVTANLKRAHTLRQSVLRRAFTGRLVPTPTANRGDTTA